MLERENDRTVNIKNISGKEKKRGYQHKETKRKTESKNDHK